MEIIGIKGFLTAIATKYRNGKKITLVCADNKPNLLTNAGKDVIHALLYTNTTTSGYAHSWSYIASSGATLTPAVTDTTLGSEITDANGLTRAEAATRTHTAAANSTLVEHTFNITGSGYADVKAAALFNALTVGTMAHIANFATSTGALASGDTLKISWTLNAS